MTHRHTSLHEVEIEWVYEYEPRDGHSPPAICEVEVFIHGRDGRKVRMPSWFRDQHIDPDSLIIAAQESSDDRRADYAAE